MAHFKLRTTAVTSKRTELNEFFRSELAVESVVFTDLFESEVGQLIRDRFNVKVIQFNAERQEVVRWTN